MKKRLFLLIAALAAMGQSAFAYDFSAVAPSGQTLFYTIIDPINHYVKLTYPNASIDENTAHDHSIQELWYPYPTPAGSLIIPDTVSYEGIVYTVKAVGNDVFKDGLILSVVMPNTLDSLAARAFLGCRYLSNVTFSNSLRYIGESAMSGCALGDVVLPPSVRVLAPAAMSGSYITSITLNDSIEEIHFHSLAGNPFTSLYIPASVRHIDAPCWYMPSSFTSIVVDPNNPYYDSRNNSNAIIDSRRGAVVQACHGTVLPEGIYELYGDAFRGCNFGTFVLPSSVLFFGMNDCHVGKLVVSSPTVRIDFGWWDTLQFLNETPPLVLNSHEIVANDMLIIVPCNTLEAYRSSDPWRHFTNIRELDAPQISVTATEHGSARVVTQPSCGNDTATVSATAEDERWHFSHWSDGSTQNPYTLVLNGDSTLTAYFSIDSANVTASAANPRMGSVVGGGNAPVNGTITLTAVPSGNNIFLCWSNGVTDNPYTLTATTDTVLSAMFTVQDTLILHDTVYINKYIHDTTFVNNYVHDTLIQYVNQYIHDTTFVNNYVHDTLIQYVNHYVHDTVFVNNYVHDTVRITTQLIDTTIVNLNRFDTVVMNVYDTTIINNFQYDTMIFNTYIYDTVYVSARYYDTIFVHDTVYITEEGIGDIETLNAKVYFNRGQIVVEGSDGNTVTLYDVTGRVLATKQDYYAPLRFDAPATGTYMIKIGKFPARKVVVVR